MHKDPKGGPLRARLERAEEELLGARYLLRVGRDDGVGPLRARAAGACSRAREGGRRKTVEGVHA